MTFRLDSLSNFNQFLGVAYGISESGCCVTIEFSLAKNGDLICSTDVCVVCWMLRYLNAALGIAAASFFVLYRQKRYSG